ncbi:hypothetical protein Gpo141_00011686 [Globisporangium polare]
MVFGRKSSKTTTAAELERPQLVKSQSADSTRSSRSSFDNTTTNSYATRDSANMTKMRSSASAGALATTTTTSASLLHKFQGERTASASALGSSSRARDGRRGKPIVVRYEQSPALDAARLQRDLDALLLSSSVESSQRTYSVDHDADDAPFDVESAISGFMASFSPTRDSKQKTKSKKTSCSQRGSTTALSAQQEFLMSNASRASTPAAPSSSTSRSRSNTLQRLSVNFSSGGGHGLRSSQRAENKAKKYDVEWRNDQDCLCCQVCYAMFTKLSRRRHHCRVCGDLVCGDCSNDQVLLVGRFEAPKRACVACVTLLQVMKHNGDPRVAIEGQGITNKAPSASQINSNAPLATPRYHDRLGEVQRVMAAGKKSERRGSTQTEMFVVSSKWLRAWLAFTRSTDGPNNQTVDPYSDTSNLNSSSNSPTNNGGALSAPPPGPIDNMPLLELSKGKLVKRPELVRDDNVGADETEGDGGDYQLISSEVWEVLQRLYGGGPSIRVVSDDGFRDWIVDVYALLANVAAHVAIPPTVENVLVTRHEAAVVTRASYISVEKAALISSGGYESVSILSQSSRASFNDGGSGRPSMSGSSMKQLGTDKASAVTDRGSFSSRASQVRVRPNSPQHYDYQQQQRASSTSTMRASAAKQQVDVAAGEDASIRDSSAATAANAFAVAMKQARLNAQKAIEDRSRARTQVE